MSTSSGAVAAEDTGKDKRQPISAELLQAAAQAAQDASSESGEEENETAETTQQPQKRKKRSRACQACRNMKIRCNPVEGQEACKACAKVNRPCIMPGPARKRQKTVHKVAELEKKIEALTQSIIAKHQGHPTPPSESPATTEMTRSSASIAPVQPSNSAPKYDPVSETMFIEPRSGLERQTSPPSSMPGPDDYVDVVDRGLITLAQANEMLEIFKQDMNPLCPLVAFHEDRSINHFRRTRPILFLTILSATCGGIVPELRIELDEEVARQIADRCMYKFEKSLDLIQAMLVHVTWCGRHKNAKEVGFNQYIHTAIIMALDMGLGKRLQAPLAKDEMEDLELRRTWLSCYYYGITVSTTLRQPAMVQNSPYIEECLKVLMKAPLAAPTDARLCSVVKLFQIMEDVHKCFHMDDPLSAVGMDDPATKYHLKLFEKRLAEWKSNEGRAIHPLILEHISSVASLFVHEIALHENHNIDDFKPAYRLPSRNSITATNFFTAAHLEALTVCVCEMKAILDTFINILCNIAKTIPCIHSVWTTYAAVAMIRLHHTLSLPGSKYGDVFLPDLNVDYYLDSIISQLSKMSRTWSTIPAFLQGFQRLKLWHRHRQVGGPNGISNDEGKDNVGPNSKIVPEPEQSGKLNGSTENAKVQSSASQMINLTGAPTWMFPGMESSEQHSNNTGESNNLTMNAPPTTFDASSFDNHDWNFTMEDWNNFDASLNEPAGSAWIGYIM